MVTSDMGVLICGSRWIGDLEILEEAIRNSGFEITRVIEGGQRKWDPGSSAYVGVDWLARIWAAKNNLQIISYPAYWHVYGRMAGMIRNSVMIRQCEAVIAVWDGKSPGTKDVIKKALARKIPLYIENVTAREGAIQNVYCL